MADTLIKILFHYRSELKYELHDFVLMPDHFHLILTPSRVTLERAIQLIKGGFSHQVSSSLNNRMEIWQKGFTDHRIRDFEDYKKHQQYIMMNPVRAGLCSLPEEYAYSSLQSRSQLDPLPQRLKPLS